MTDDIVALLRDQEEFGLLGVPGDHRCVSWGDAADEIERLRAAIDDHLTWFEKFICNSDALDSTTPRKIAQNAQDAAAELRAALAGENNNG